MAIDGPAASGKGTVARAVADVLGYRYLDTGAMYRALALVARQRGVPLTDEAALADLARSVRMEFRAADGPGPARIFVDGHDLSEAIRTQQVGEDASAIAVYPAVRRALVALQQALAAEGGVVVDGRDIGTVVLPDAELKIYLDATPEERARRRWAELQSRGVDVGLDEVLAEIHRRDRQDSGRATGPLRKADDAITIDTTGRPPDDVLAEILARAAERGARPPTPIAPGSGADAGRPTTGALDASPPDA
ncbi:MAG: (d)CMP kinase [Deltaproteobacteria bacterium]|nr:MAG: (d)CMP kinase [Deltaproteobacteria bacterium]